MDPSRLTERSQQALHDAQTKALRFGHTEISPEHLLLALLDLPEGLVSRLLVRAGIDTDDLRRSLEAELERRPRVSGAGSGGEARVSRALAQLLDEAEQQSQRLKDEYVSVEHLVLAMLEDTRQHGAGQLLRERGITSEAFLRTLLEVRGSQRVTSSTPEASYEALEKYGRDPRLRGAQRAPRSGDRARRGDPSRDPDPLAQDQEQPGADRRPGCRQDRDRRRARTAHRAPRRARGAARQDRLRARPGIPCGGGEVSRRVRGAAQGRAAGDHGRRGPDRALHRRAAHRRRRRCRRGRDGRRQHAEADARTGRAALHRGHHARRVPHDREGRPRSSAASSR